MEKGIIYIVYSAQNNDKFYKETIHSINTLKKTNPNLPVTVFTDKKLDCNLIDNTVIIPKNEVELRIKHKYLLKSPYEKTLYLDTDTHVNYDINEMFDILDKYEIALVHDFARKRSKYSNMMPEYKKIPYAFSEFNCGIFLYKKCPNVEKCIKLWEHYFNKYKSQCPYDQPSGRIAFWESGINIHTLPLEYNRRSKQNRKKATLLQYKDILGKGHLSTRIYHNHGLVNRTPKNFDSEFHYV